MSYCINPNCPKPQNTGKPLYCLVCGSQLLLEDCYRVTKPLGGGGFGKTFEVDDCGTLKVLKVLFNTHPKAVELFQKEAEVLSQLQHPGIPKVGTDGYFTYKPRNSPESLHCLVMEKIEGMNLEEYLIQRHYQPISERAAIRWLKQLAEILQQVHQRQYFHRDIKPPNIMIRPDGQLALIDFGTAREVTQTYLQRLEGQQVTGIISAGYTPMEQMNGKAVMQSDFFALGRTFVYLLTGKFPNDFPEDSLTGKLIWQNEVTQVSKELVDLIDYLMAPFPGNRPQNAQEILQRLSASKLPAPDPDGEENKPSLIYAGFWRRFFAYSIDSSILIAITVLFGKVGFGFGSLLPESAINSIGVLGFTLILAAIAIMGEAFGSLYLLLLCWVYYSTNKNVLISRVIIYVLICLVLKWFYFTFFESSRQQATIGKQVLGIIVTDSNKKQVSFSKSNVRYWSKNISSIIIFVGFIMAGFTQKKQAIHDKIAGTIVVKKG